MRLLRIADRQLVQRHKLAGNPEYAILSHKWLEGDAEEIIMDELSQLTQLRQHPIKERSIWKLDLFCAKAAADGYKYVWLDTCCIDQKNAVELQTSINSMFQWYREAAVCYVFLSQFDSATSSDPTGDVWFTRGWTLQEFIAPRNIKVFDMRWQCVGEFGLSRGYAPEKNEIMQKIYQKTMIDKSRLGESDSMHQFSIAHRMSWYRGRSTTVPEDNAYCLIGIFAVNMPLLYGEGKERAFRRLQEEIMKTSDDHSLFAWRLPSTYIQPTSGLLAPSPDCFENSGRYYYQPSRLNKRPYAMTNKGLEIDLFMMQIPGDLHVATLDCPEPGTGDHLSIYLKQANPLTDQYVRVDADKPLPRVQNRGGLRTLFIKQPL